MDAQSTTMVLVNALRRAVAWDITALAQQWIANPAQNNGVALRAAPMKVTFASQEDLARTPQLFITYEVKDNPSCPSGPTGGGGAVGAARATGPSGAAGAPRPAAVASAARDTGRAGRPR